MDGGEGGRQLCDSLTSGCCGTSPGGKRRLIRGGAVGAASPAVLAGERPCWDPVDRSPGTLSSRIWKLWCRTIPEWQTIHLWRCQISQVTLLERPELPCWCRTIPEWHTNRPRICRTSQVTLIEQPECLCWDPVN